MSFNIDPRQILEYLNELGYYNISAYQLKEFIKDLKKLIKYEQRNHSSEVIQESPSFNSENQDESRQLQNVLARFSQLHTTQTVSSQAKIVDKQKPETKTVQKPRRPLQTNSNMINIESVSTVFNYKPTRNIQLTRIVRTDTPASIDTVDDKQTSASKIDIENTKQCTCDHKKTDSDKNSLKRSKSFIRPRNTNSKFQLYNRCDPVTLYHKYQAEWKQIKLPGENSHAGLRWAIREKMLGEPKISSTVSSVHGIKKSKNKLPFA